MRPPPPPTSHPQVKHTTVKVTSGKTGPNGEQYCWWQCTVKGGREGRDIGAVELAQVSHYALHYVYVRPFICGVCM